MPGAVQSAPETGTGAPTQLPCMSELILPPQWKPAPGAAVRRAATVVVLRQSSEGMQVLLMRRNARAGDIHSGACVFPGGLVDAADRHAHAFCTGLDDAQSSARIGLESGGLDFHVAAVRECLEEAGLLFATTADGAPVAPQVLDEIAALRPALNRGDLSLKTLCERFGLRLPVDRLVRISHWLTPPGAPKRYDTHFFVAEAPALQVATHDEGETVARLWIAPAEAVVQAHGLKLVLPTVRTLQTLAQLGSVEAVLAHARALSHVPCWMPHLGTGSRGVRPVAPDEHAWAELGRLDPEGHGTASYELAPGRAVRLSPRLVRITAPNGSMMTGPGTNTYLLGGGEDNEWAVIDPGPALDEHVQAIVDGAPGRIRWIFVTHTHKDHSPAAVALKALTGASVLGMAPLHAEWQDADFAPDVPLCGGEVFELPGPAGQAGQAAGTTLRVIHTPGHAGNHLCYLLDQERMLFTGDHVMQGSTVVINPPDGDMSAYLQSLAELKQLPLAWLAPGHGFLMAEPAQAMQRIIDHRLKREAKVLAAVPAGAVASMDALLATVYADVPPHLHAMARRSLLAHLLKLQRDGRLAEQPGGGWVRA
jgi:glyoxylase-like metal-dependent hydrolase (beta-lactamase superfamily II)/8-oxo-dGTP pyrophosphatase MutT (NUDIX family)